MPLTPLIFLNATYNFSIFSPYHSHFWERPFPFLGKLLPFPFLGKPLPFPFLGMVFGRRILYILFYYSFLYSTHFWERPFPFLGKPFPFLGKPPIFYRRTFPIIGKVHSHFWEKVGAFPIFGNGSEVKNELFPIFGNGTFPIFGNLFLLAFPIFGKIITIPIIGNGTFCKSRTWIKHAIIYISQLF